MKRNILVIVFLSLAVCCFALLFVSCSTESEPVSETTDVTDNAAISDESEHNESVSEDTVETFEETPVYNITDEEISNNKLLENMNMSFAESMQMAFELYSQTLELSFPIKMGVASANNRRYSEGTEYVLNGWSLTEEIDIKDAKKIQCYITVADLNYSVVYYDENHEFIGGVNISDNIYFGYEMRYLYVDIPENAAYVRFANHDECQDASASICGDIGGKLYEYWQKRIDYDISGLKISCLGDSLTEGFPGCPEGYDMNKTMSSQSYPAFLGNYFGAETSNYGYGGITAMTYLEKYKDKQIDIKDSDVIILMLGTNIIGSTESATEYELLKHYYELLIMQIMSDMKSTATVILCTPPPATVIEERKNYGHNEHIKESCKVVRSLAEQFDLPLIDTYTDFGIVEKNEYVVFPIDGIHLGGVGHEAFSVFFGTEIKKILQAKDLESLN